MSLQYNLETQFLKKVEDPNNITNKREILTDDQIKSILEKHPKIPKDYIAYLQKIGSGNFRECKFKVHHFLFDLEDIGLEDHYELKSNVYFFGDNYCGDFSGFDFDNNDGNVVEFWHESGELYYTNQSFHTYIREQMQIDENENN